MCKCVREGACVCVCMRLCMCICVFVLDACTAQNRCASVSHVSARLLGAKPCQEIGTATTSDGGNGGIALVGEEFAAGAPTVGVEQRRAEACDAE